MTTTTARLDRLSQPLAVTPTRWTALWETTAPAAGGLQVVAQVQALNVVTPVNGTVRLRNLTKRTTTDTTTVFGLATGLSLPVIAVSTGDVVVLEAQPETVGQIHVGFAAGSVSDTGLGGTPGDVTPPVVATGQEFTVAADATVGTAVGTVAATDNVAVTEFAFTAGNTGTAFAISNAGAVTVANQAAVQANGPFTLGVVARDAAGNEGTGAVAVTVTSSTPAYASVAWSEDGTSSNSTSHSFDPPTTAAGDRVVAVIYFGDYQITEGAEVAANWTEIKALDVFTDGNLNLRIYDRQCTGDISGTPITFTTNAGCKASVKFGRVQGAATGGLGAAVSVSAGAATDFGLTPDPDAVNAAWGSDLNLFITGYIAGNTGATLVSPPTGYTSGGGTSTANGGTVGVAHRQLTAGSDNPGTFTISDGTAGENHRAFTLVYRPAVGSGGGASTGTPAPTIPTFNSGSATTITTGQNIKTIIEAAAEGTHFLIAAGTHTTANGVLLKSNQHVRLASGCILEGNGLNYCFRPSGQNVTGVAIGGDPSGTRPIIRNYGNGTSDQGFGAIMGRTDDVLAGQFLYRDVDNWFIYHLDLERNASNGLKLGSNFTVYDCEFHGHTVTGIQGDRTVGGLIHSCELYWNALNPNTGVGSNGAQIKMTWTNADIGRTAVTPVDRAKAPFVISNCVFEAGDRDGGSGSSKIGVWFDLDCQDCLVEYSTFDDHSSTSIFWEGCNNGEAAYNTINNSDGYGPEFNGNFANAALCAGESTNIRFHHNTLTGCTYALMNRMSNRTSDWYNSNNASYVNYAWASGPRYWILNTTAIPAVSGQSNMWTGNNTFDNNTLISCGKVVINEGTDGGGQTTHGSTPLATIVFADNEYGGSSGIQFYEASATALNLSQWQALGRQ